MELDIPAIHRVGTSRIYAVDRCRGDCGFEVFNDDCQQMPLPIVAERARTGVRGITPWPIRPGAA